MKKKFIYFFILSFFSQFIFCNSPKKVAIVHYRVGKTDGVSLEIEKRKQILQDLGCQVRLISGPVQNGADFIIDELEFENDEIRLIKENSFAHFSKKYISPKVLIRRIDEIAQIIEEKFLCYNEQEHFDLILLHNIFSLGLHLPAAQAFTNIANKLGIPIIATHHDHYWERQRFQNTSNQLIYNFLETYVPPCLENITHVCINSLAQEKLKKKKGIHSVVFPDVFDFTQKPWIKDDYNADFLEKIGAKPNDIIVLQATRIVERKGIELAIQFVKELQGYLDELIGKRLYNGKLITKDSDIIFVLAGYPEKFALPYVKKLKQQIMHSGVHAKFVYDLIDAERSFKHGKKIYSLWDAYVFADMITYPSLWEGWGNQFIETVFAKKPIVVFEYPVFEQDIKKEGYSVISLGNSIEGKNNLGLAKISSEKIIDAVQNAIFFLTSKNTVTILDNNFKIGKKYHDFYVLKDFLKTIVDKI